MEERGSEEREKGWSEEISGGEREGERRGVGLKREGVRRERKGWSEEISVGERGKEREEGWGGRERE